jgi:hypothetical protein
MARQIEAGTLHVEHLEDARAEVPLRIGDDFPDRELQCRDQLLGVRRAAIGAIGLEQPRRGIATGNVGEIEHREAFVLSEREGLLQIHAIRDARDAVEHGVELLDVSDPLVSVAGVDDAIPDAGLGDVEGERKSLRGRLAESDCGNRRHRDPERSQHGRSLQL